MGSRLTKPSLISPSHALGSEGEDAGIASTPTSGACYTGAGEAQDTNGSGKGLDKYRMIDPHQATEGKCGMFPEDA